MITSSNSMVLSMPAALSSSSLPPGWNLKYGVMLYTLPKREREREREEEREREIK